MDNCWLQQTERQAAAVRAARNLLLSRCGTWVGWEQLVWHQKEVWFIGRRHEQLGALKKVFCSLGIAVPALFLTLGACFFYLVLQDEQQLAALRSMGVAGAVQHLLHTTTGLGSLLHRAPVLVSRSAFSSCTPPSPHCACRTPQPTMLCLPSSAWQVQLGSQLT